MKTCLKGLQNGSRKIKINSPFSILLRGKKAKVNKAIEKTKRIRGVLFVKKILYY